MWLIEYRYLLAVPSFLIKSNILYQDSTLKSYNMQSEVVCLYKTFFFLYSFHYGVFVD